MIFSEPEAGRPGRCAKPPPKRKAPGGRPPRAPNVTFVQPLVEELVVSPQHDQRPVGVLEVIPTGRPCALRRAVVDEAIPERGLDLVQLHIELELEVVD